MSISNDLDKMVTKAASLRAKLPELEKQAIAIGDSLVGDAAIGGGVMGGTTAATLALDARRRRSALMDRLVSRPGSNWKDLVNKSAPSLHGRVSNISILKQLLSGRSLKLLSRLGIGGAAMGVAGGAMTRALNRRAQL